MSNTSKTDTETRLINRKLDFTASYLSVKTIRADIEKAPESATELTIDALASILTSTRFDSEKQALFLYREACKAMVSLVRLNRNPLSHQIIPTLQTMLVKSSKNRHRAIAETLGTLPLNSPSFPCEPEPETCFTLTSFETLAKKLKIRNIRRMKWFGRSLAGETLENRTGVIKFVKQKASPFALTLETGWMDFLSAAFQDKEVEFDIPVPLRSDTSSLFKLKEMPEKLGLNPTHQGDIFVIAFTADKNYFKYPNEKASALSKKELVKIMNLNAWLLGRCTSLGVVHTSPIPLFHNRVQQNRRHDLGVYRWEQGGRLDRWLESSRYPNFAASGLRDFEHFELLKTHKKRGHYLGSHILSLVLVAGSYFRNLSPELRGKNQIGQPVNATALFDKALFTQIIDTTVKAYFKGFTGGHTGQLPEISSAFMDALIEKMGIDDHMEEVLRINDQNNMDQETFENFLMERGFNRETIAVLKKGKKEITINTGPHLGGFNQKISVPQLTDFLFTCSALCISEKYTRENGLKPMSDRTNAATKNSRSQKNRNRTEKPHKND
ncbi:MAG: SidJ-related pseudokinase [Thermodesulfobacteriota bacterium]|nr:SidJ-related pseudokinase [Thermodesulfobacteriota bacterium]